MQEDRRSCLRQQDNIPELLLVQGTAQSKHGVLFVAVVDEAAAKVHVVRREASYQVVQPQVVSLQRIRIGLYVVLFGQSAPAVDLADTGNAAQLITDLPVMQSLAIHNACGAIDGVLVDFAAGGSQGPACWLEALGK